MAGEPSQCRQPVSVAVPFKPKAVENLSGWWLGTSDSNSAVSSVKAISHWPDGSVKWALAKSVFTPVADCLPDWQLHAPSSTDESMASNISPLQVVETYDHLIVRDGDLSYEFKSAGQQIFPDVYAGEVQTWVGDDFRIATTGVDNGTLEFEKSSLTVAAQDAVSVLIRVCGFIAVSSSIRLDVSLQFEILCGRWLRLGVCIHNPHRARHPESLWDLGDSGSIKFSEFALSIVRKSAGSLKIQAEPGIDWHVTDSEKTTLFQASSGGRNWDSPNHVDATGKVCSRFKGYSVEVLGREIQRGDRATPLVWVDADNGSHWGIKIPQYWQTFPKCLGLDQSSITVGLFPVEHCSDYELQGGERKHHEIIFSFSDDTNSLDWVDRPVMLTVPAATVLESQVLRYSENDGGEAYNELISKSLCADSGFLAKREIIDEFGWRNFGDIYADHETLYHDSDDLFISHYNNQYDAIYGFGRQYLLTGDVRWYQLMDDLARHVLDIDIYRTDEDRAEYNHGLFWHTNHYLKAYTSSHRSYSREHYIDWRGGKGGGPGCEHCYTNGLLLYYQLTGDTEARDAVVGLTSWIRHYHEGTGTVLEAFKNIVSDKRRDFQSLCKGHDVFRYKYRLDRGTGNYMQALLDCFEITGDKSYISETEAILMATFGSNDDLAARNLDDPENTWFYSIFLQGVIRYLDVKRDLCELDTAFCYARNGLLYYARWIAENETPYLSRPGRLEFPNDTWVAQDIRKANVLYAAYRYATVNRDELLTRARYFRDYVLEVLSESDTVHFSRIQILMLQNHGPSGLMDTTLEPYSELKSLPVQVHPQLNCFYTIPGFVSAVLGQLWNCVRNFSFARELRWVKARIG
nr:hypothetical protein [Granulosicoccus sp.]